MAFETDTNAARKTNKAQLIDSIMKNLGCELIDNWISEINYINLKNDAVVTSYKITNVKTS